MPTWLINGTAPATLGLALPKLTYTSMAADVLTVDHLTAAWDADPIFNYAQLITLTRDGVPVFVGRVRRFPRFAGPTAETTSYEISGPWDWLERRAFLQETAVVTDASVSTTPIYVAQGFVILNQADDGTSVNIAASLGVVLDQAIAAGVPIQRGTITGFDYATGWDEITDLTLADAIIRLLASAPDAVVWWDYTTTNGLGLPRPTIHIGRRAELATTPLAIAPAGTAPAAFAAGTYAEFESLRLTSRPDLVVPGVFVTYRRTNTTNGSTYLRLEEQSAGTGTRTAENALNRTVQLTGSSFTETVLSQECKTLPLAGALTGEGTVTVTSGSDFDELVKFWTRKVPALAQADVVIKGFKNRLREAAPVASTTGELIKPALDTSLTRELIEGAITPWMREGGLNRKGQEQNFTARIAYSIKGVDQKDSEGMGIVFSAGVMATNASTRTYSFQESADFSAGETTPAGLAAALYAAMSSLQHEGEFTLAEREATLALRPGQVVNLTGGRAEWAEMRAVVQSAASELTTGRTQVTLGWPRHLTADDLTSILRANRLKKTAQAGLIRTSGGG